MEKEQNMQIQPKYEFVVSRIERVIPTLWVLEVEPFEGEMINYPAGTFFLFNFTGVDKIGTERRSFSASSASTKRYKNSIEFMIKESGEWTKSLEHVRVGDAVILEGPYGYFYDENKSLDESVPYILLSGGIGLTPNLSILRSEIEKGSQRKIDLVWGLSYEEDLFMLDELESYKQVNPNFNYHVIFSNEEVEGYPYGFIDNEFLKSIGADDFEKGHFFICGPRVMLYSCRDNLLNVNVAEERIHMDDFGY